MVKVGFLVSYDYDYLFTALELVYDDADKIFISIDKDRLTWSGNPFNIPQSFFDKVKSLDSKHKIVIHEDSFYISEIALAKRQTRQRKLLHKKMGKGWKVFLDVDEYVYDFKSVFRFLNRYSWIGNLPHLFPIMLRGKLITLYKKDENGYYYIDNGERFSFITNQYNFIFKRNNKKIKNHYTNIAVVHQSWARKEKEVKMKFENWCHKFDFNTDEQFQFWKNVNSSNYKEIKNFHPLHGHIWPELKFIEAADIKEFIEKYSNSNPQNIRPISYKILIKSLLRINR